MSQVENPYASPQIGAEAVAMPVPAEAMKIASQGKRFLNLIIDNILVQILSAVAGFVVGLCYAVLRVGGGGQITPQDQFSLNMLGYLVGILAALVYYVGTEALFQRTLAKFITGTMVVTPDGRAPSFGQIVGRSFARFIPFEGFSFLGKNQPVGWHDSLSGTRVIDLR